jgi:hypothetical protein
MLQDEGIKLLTHVRYRATRERLRRPVVLALVMLGHIGLLMVMLRPAAPWRVAIGKRDHHDTEAMRLHFIHLSTRHASPQPQTSAPVHVAVMHEQHATVIPRTPASKPAPTAIASVDIPLVSASPANTETYVSGGAAFQKGLHADDDAASFKVPGGYVPRAPRFHMVDPTSQGVAGLIHFIGRLTGAEDPHCVDVDTWRGMTYQEQIAHHLSQSDIDQVAAEHGCVPPQHFHNTVN